MRSSSGTSGAADDAGAGEGVRGAARGACPSTFLRLRAPPAPTRLVGHLVALVEGLETITLYAGVVDEEVLAPLVGRDKAVALLAVEPLYRSLRHVLEPAFLLLDPSSNGEIPTLRRHTRCCPFPFWLRAILICCVRLTLRQQR
jgi:hypothetical protein